VAAHSDSDSGLRPELEPAAKVAEVLSAREPKQAGKLITLSKYIARSWFERNYPSIDADLPVDRFTQAVTEAWARMHKGATSSGDV
jgi:hypothetical protein